MEETLRRRAKLYLCCPEGVFPAPDGPALLDKLTDEVLLVASDVVTSAAAASHEKISGKAQLRCLAWLLADARGSPWWCIDVGLDKAAAETVGKRCCTAGNMSSHAAAPLCMRACKGLPRPVRIAHWSRPAYLRRRWTEEVKQLEREVRIGFGQKKRLESSERTDLSSPRFFELAHIWVNSSCALESWLEMYGESRCVNSSKFYK